MMTMMMTTKMMTSRCISLFFADWALTSTHIASLAQ